MKLMLRKLIMLFPLKKKLKKKMLLPLPIIIIHPLRKPKPFKIKSLQLELVKSLEKFHFQEILEAGNWSHQAPVMLSPNRLVKRRRRPKHQRKRRKMRPRRHQRRQQKLQLQLKLKLLSQLRKRPRLQLRRRPKLKPLQPKRKPKLKLKEMPPQLN